MFEKELILSTYLVCVGFFGLITSRNMVRALMSLELILNGIILNFIIFSNFFTNREGGEIFSLFIITVAAAEAATGLAIALSIHRIRKSTRIDQLNLLKW
uniref:NAD(P)H-quinone oxidoreductase subunit 4L, chloroplastic n=4 Tax=Ceratopteris TaxID=29595 RepID=A0A097A097_CERRI|nr:NADH-plastoquinone oxidoreductase subunit 4L [Pteris vittata]YP_010328094.1 NADH-plastoquinone oxidoreductase subunit 4L [Ceratopteris thalictroides]YP_010487993.1 NADH-plastoquinone oxidoreductase subunit 4L [Ceratopteris pteridoides]AIS38291.1 NADH-plastoquinone oxidoreductase subunit 4L [Ceratopteris richardii]AYW14742.1 NADH-plastoquinone oxidoreductase subunit 4L [Ceratopteris cornuta]UJH19159.1 NADH-plastoquinone oxidoreductase subunit 4L [Ceratopteris thalictroides]UWI72095.1 NADH-p